MQIDIPAVGVLYQARQFKAESWKRVKRLRQQIKEAGLFSGNLRLDLLKAESAHREAIAMEIGALNAIATRKEELGL